MLVVEVASFDGLRSSDPTGADAAVGELARRLDRLIRGGDVLGFEPPARFLIGCSSVAAEGSGGLVDRIRGGVALPVEIGGHPMSLVVDVGMAFWTDGSTADELMATAEADLGRPLPEV